MRREFGQAYWHYHKYIVMASASFLLILVVGTIVTGCLNSLFTKYQDNQCVRHCDNPDPATHTKFEQPALQTLQMFIGEMSIFVVYWVVYHTQLSGGATARAKLPLRHRLKLALPAVCDLCGTTLVNIGLFYTPVLVYQMTRGSIVLFVAIFSVAFLGRRITKLEWISLVFVSLGVVIVGMSAKATPHVAAASDASLLVFGMCLIIVAAVLQAAQFVIEEHILAHHELVPLELVYCEGFYGTVVLVVVLACLHFVVGLLAPLLFAESPFNMIESFAQMFGNRRVLVSSVCIMVLISLFNFFGILLTHQLSATARSTVDTCRTLLVWVLAMAMGWESFAWGQLFGFAAMVFGTLCFNGVLDTESWGWIPRRLKEGEHQPLLNTTEEDPLVRL